MQRFISFSGGVESTTMCLLFGKSAKAIFADTGWEHKLMYERLDNVENEIKKVHPDFKVIRVKNKKYGNLKDYIKKQKFYPSFMSRYCTRMFKIEPIDKYLKNQGNCELMIGLNFDEQDRTGNHGLIPTVKYTYPLIKNRITRQACIDILKKAKLLPSFPSYMQRGGCVGCFFKSHNEFLAMAQINKEEFDEVKELEKIIQDKRDSFYAIQGNRHTMQSIEDKSKSLLFKHEEMYSEKDISTPCGVFCHR